MFFLPVRYLYVFIHVSLQGHWRVFLGIPVSYDQQIPRLHVGQAFLPSMDLNTSELSCMTNVNVGIASRMWVLSTYFFSASTTGESYLIHSMPFSLPGFNSFL